jgi:hypothetical protein
LAKRRRLRQTNRAGYDVVTDERTEVGSDFVDDLTGELGAWIEHHQHDVADL